MGKSELFFIEGNNLFAVAGAPYHNFAALYGVEVECVHRLTHFKQHKVGYIHNVAYGAKSAQSEAPSHPYGGWACLYIFYIVSDVSGAEFGSLYAHLNFFVALF